MAPKAEKLGQTLENLQLFLNKRSGEHEGFEAIALELEKLHTHLEQKKLTIQIVSQDPVLAQALFDLIAYNKKLLEFYKLKFDTLPSIPQEVEPQRFFSLKLQHLRDDSTDFQYSYELNPDREHLIGRDPDCFINLESGVCKGISWHHAKLQSSDNDNSQHWEICDFNSTNGTFVNGERIQECQVLQAKDKITLGYPQGSINTPELHYNIQISMPDTEINQPYWEIIDCDVLFIVVSSNQTLSSIEQEFIQNFDRTLMSKQFLVIDIPDSSEVKAENNIKANVANIDNWIKKHASNSEFEIFSLFLQPYYEEERDKELKPELQKKQDLFFKSLEKIVKRQPENILAKRLAIKVERDLEPVDIVLQRHQEKLTQTISQEKNELETLTQANLKEITKKSISSVNEDKDKFFKQVKNELAQSKAALLDNFSKRSIIYQIQDFVNNLKPNVLNREGHKYIQLKDEANSKSKDINMSLVDFCTSSLEKWAIEEWHKICNVYGDAGLNALLERSYNSIKVIPSVIKETPFSSPQSIDVRNNFMVSFAPVSCEVRHKQISLGAYIMKQLRSQMMQGMMMITLVLSMVGIQAGKSQLMGQLSGLFKQIPWLFGIIIFGIIYLLVNAYKKDDNLKLEEAGEKLKKDLSGYYQSFAKNMLEKIIQDLNLALESEDKRISNALDITNDLYQDYILETEKKQIQIKNNIEQYKSQQDTFKKELVEFKKLKRL